MRSNLAMQRDGSRQYHHYLLFTITDTCFRVRVTQHNRAASSCGPWSSNPQCESGLRTGPPQAGGICAVVCVCQLGAWRSPGTGIRRGGASPCGILGCRAPAARNILERGRARLAPARTRESAAMAAVPKWRYRRGANFNGDTRSSIRKLIAQAHPPPHTAADNHMHHHSPDRPPI